jgi:hypothetical protein
MANLPFDQFPVLGFAGITQAEIVERIGTT